MIKQMDGGNEASDHPLAQVTIEATSRFRFPIDMRKSNESPLVLSFPLGPHPTERETTRLTSLVAVRYSSSTVSFVSGE